jgi:hypothetical protein
MGYQIAGDQPAEDDDQSDAPLEQASPDKAAVGGQEAASAPPAPPAAPAPPRVTLAVSAPVSALHVPPLEDGGEVVVITRDGTEVDEVTARRAHEAADFAGFTLREI